VLSFAEVHQGTENTGEYDQLEYNSVYDRETKPARSAQESVCLIEGSYKTGAPLVYKWHPWCTEDA